MNMTTEQSTETNTEFEEHLVHTINSAICELFDIHAYENESVGFTLAEIKPESLATLTDNIGVLVEALKIAHRNKLPEFLR